MTDLNKQLAELIGEEWTIRDICDPDCDFFGCDNNPVGCGYEIKGPLNFLHDDAAFGKLVKYITMELHLLIKLYDGYTDAKQIAICRILKRPNFLDDAIGSGRGNNLNEAIVTAVIAALKEK